MAKNTSSSAFRKINVDQYNEDNFKEDEIDSNGTAYTGPDDAEITKLINTGKGIEALKLLLEHAPLTSKNQQAKVNFDLKNCCYMAVIVLFLCNILYEHNFNCLLHIYHFCCRKMPDN